MTNYRKGKVAFWTIQVLMGCLLVLNIIGVSTQTPWCAFLDGAMCVYIIWCITRNAIRERDREEESA